MAKLTLEIITGERLLFREEEIDEVIAPGVEKVELNRFSV